MSSHINDYEDFTISIPIIPVDESPSRIAHSERSKQKETKVENSNLDTFSNTVYFAFKKLTLQYNSPQISLTAAEIFSYVIGMKYKSEIRGEVEIKPTLTYFNRLLKVLKNKFQCSNDRYYLLQ